jgi:hypothetical protein
MQVIIQPSFTVVDKTDRVGLISSMEILLKKRGGNPDDAGVPLQWNEVGELRRPPEGRQRYVFTADPAPFIVTQESPQSPVLLFQYVGRDFEPGIWDATLRIRRAADQETTEAKFCLDINDDTMQVVDEPDRVRRLRNDIENGATPGLTNCYHQVIFEDDEAVGN